MGRTGGLVAVVSEVVEPDIPAEVDIAGLEGIGAAELVVAGTVVGQIVVVDHTERAARVVVGGKIGVVDVADVAVTAAVVAKRELAHT